MRATAVNCIEDHSVKTGILALRARWVQVRKYETEFTVVVAQMMLQPCPPTDSVACVIALQMLDLGFKSVMELDSVNVSSWPFRCASARLYAESLCNSSSRQVEANRKSSVTNDRIQENLKSKPRAESAHAKLGPTAEIKSARLDEVSQLEKERRLNSIAIEAAVTSVERSLDSYKSGVRAWILFYNFVDGGACPFPPCLEMLLYFCSFFRNAGTLCNYVTHIKWACEAARVDLSVFHEPLLRRAKQCIRSITIPRNRK